MGAVRRRSWLVLVAMSVLVALLGLGDLLIGATFDPAVALGLTGVSLAEIEAASAAGYRLVDFGVRSGGINLMVIGALLTIILVIPFREGRRWAWWAMWALPAWATGAFILNSVFGVAAGQAPPPSMVSGPIFAALAAAILLVTAPRFFGRGRRQEPDAGMGERN